MYKVVFLLFCSRSGFISNLYQSSEPVRITPPIPAKPYAKRLIPPNVSLVTDSPEHLTK